MTKQEILLRLVGAYTPENERAFTEYCNRVSLAAVRKSMKETTGKPFYCVKQLYAVAETCAVLRANNACKRCRQAVAWSKRPPAAVNV